MNVISQIFNQTIINIMQQRSCEEEEGYKFFITQDPSQQFKINNLVERLKPQGNIQHITTIQLNNKKAELEYRFSRDKKGIPKIFVTLNIKNHILEIECFHMLKRFEIKWLNKKLTQLIAKINDRQKYSTHALTIRYENQRKTLNIQSILPLQQLTSNFMGRITKVIQESHKNMQEIEQNITQKKTQCEAKNDRELLKQQEMIEENRLRREKSTRISLLSQINTQIESKIVDYYLLNPGKIRKVQYNYRAHKQLVHKKLESTPVISSSSGQSQAVKKYKNTVLKGILLQKQTEIQNITSGGFGYAFKCHCQFSQLLTLCSEAQQQIDAMFRGKNEQVPKVPMSDILIKKFPKNQEAARSQFKNQLHYLYMMRDLQCPQIAQHYRVQELESTTHGDSEADAISFSNSQYLYSKYYPYQLTQYTSKNVDIRLKIMIDLFQGVSFLEKHNLLHRDIKPQNIRLNNKSQIKIIDFGSANFNYRIFDKASKSEKFGRTAKYFLSYGNTRLCDYNISMEQFYCAIYYDMFACGIIMDQMFQNELDPPFIHKHTKYISQKCMQKNPYDRISPQECVKYLSKILKVQSFISEI